VRGAKEVRRLPDEDIVPIDPDIDRGAGGRTTARAASLRPAVLGAISAGGVLGASARYGVARLWPVAAGRFPWATFWTNVSGSFVLGFVLVLIVERFPPSRYVRPFVATGFLGAYTTFSTFVVETDVLIRDGHAATGVMYAAASVLVGLGVAWAGVAAGRATSPGPPRPRSEPVE
jgi:CrcB protein